jgi:hypothetical protein
MRRPEPQEDLQVTVVKLQRHAPEASAATRCAVCDTTDAARVTDHVMVGTPGVPEHDEGMCEACGAVLDKVAHKYGRDLSLLVEESQHEASEREITVPGAKKPARRKS